MKQKVVFLMSIMFMAFVVAGCSSDDRTNDDPDNPIIGTWELTSVIPVWGDESVIPSESQDLFYFKQNGKLHVTRNSDNGYYCFLEDGIYDYSYDNEKQEIRIKGQAYRCTFMDGKMKIQIAHAYEDKIAFYAFTKK